jgi:uncharacterized peroxidase-related enzyme
LLDAIESDWQTAELDPRRDAMLAYAEKLTVNPARVTQDDIEGLRAVGFSDRDILDICEVAAYYAYVNRIADGLGVKLETWLSPD